MSLINDALKKASQSQQTVPPPAETKEPLRVATHTPAPRWPMFVVPPIVAVVFAAGTLLVVRGWQGSRLVSAREDYRNPAAVSASQVNQAAVAVAGGAATLPHAAAPATNAADVALANGAATLPPVFPNLRLQGILWQPSRPSAVVNNKSVFVGEKVGQAKVTAITQESVTVVWNGEERVLTLP